MSILIVVNNPADWPLEVPDVELVTARSYLADPQYNSMRGVKVFNLCRSYRYQSLGYYVSLLAAARGHKPLPNISTIQDMKSQTIVRFVSDDLEELIETSLAPIKSSEFTLSVYFGRNLARRYDRLCLNLFNLFQAPLMRARFVYEKSWQLQNIRPIAASDIPEEHRPFIVEVAREYFMGRRAIRPKRSIPVYDMAILYDESEEAPPSNEKAIQRFVKAADSLGIGTEIIERDDYGRLAEFDALFIRETTGVNHHTYRFARRAVAEGLVVVDDPESILRCTNKVYLAELLNHHHIPTPRTVIVHRDNLGQVVGQLGLPLVLKQPDSYYSHGVVKIETEAEFPNEAERMLDKSELVIAQEFVPTAFDWRIGIFNQQPIYACKYFMARRHWQIIKRDGAGNSLLGKVEPVPLELVPRVVVRMALRAANLIGDGLYGVDLKQLERSCCVIEVNDNPSIDAGYEDAILKDTLYTRIMEIFLSRIRRRKELPHHNGSL